MDENNIKEVVNGLSPQAVDELSKLYDDTDTPTGMAFISMLLSLPDADFEIIRPLVQDSFVEAYNDPQVQLQMMQALAQSGISLDDVLNHTDEMFEAIIGEGIDLSESKKDFFKFIFTALRNALELSQINPAHVVSIPVEICREGAKLPTYATNGSGAMDIYSPEEVRVAPGETKIVPIGIKVAIPHGYALLIQPRSGLSRKIKLRIPNSPGLIDEDYHEEIGVIVENIDQLIKDVDIDPVSDHVDLVKLHGGDITIGKSERFAQMRLVQVPRVQWKQVSSLGKLDLSEDHGAGFGSTGVS